MKVILKAEVRGKGGEGDVVEVARGYANNYLIPQGFAELATKGNLKQLEARKSNIAKREEKRIADAEALKAQLEAAPVFVQVAVGDEGHLFGSVTNVMIAAAVAEKLGLDIDRRRIEVTAPIKMAGEHTVEVSLYREIKAALKVQVGAEPVVEAEPEAEPEVEEAVEAVEEAVEAAE